jgi:hypothetical protein
MSRSLDSSTKTALTQPTLYLVWILRLDIATDPLYVHTGLGNLYFASGSGYDPPIVGYTFLGIGNIGSIDPITDDVNGSQSLTLNLPGVNLSSDYLHQLVSSGDLWQRRQGWLWCATFDATGALVGKPFRVKTARMDQMPITIDPDNSTGTITVTLESQQAYAGEALFSRYSEQSQVDPTDMSQVYIPDLFNKIPKIGDTTSDAASVNYLAARNAAQLAFNSRK